MVRDWPVYCVPVVPVAAVANVPVVEPVTLAIVSLAGKWVPPEIWSPTSD
jgi:hypothetical protein